MNGHIKSAYCFFFAFILEQLLLIEKELKMKKFIAIIALIIVALLLTIGCGSKNNNMDNSGSAQNIPASSKSNRVIIYTAAEDERIAYLQGELDKKFHDIEIVIQSLGTGQLLSKLQAEGSKTDCDIFYDLEVVNAEIILNADPELFADLSEYDFTIYDSSVSEYTSRHKKYAVNGKTYGAFLVNENVLKEKGLAVPETYQDMLKEDYRDLISIPSPTSSGTGYSYYNGMVTILGDEEGMAYFDTLDANIKEYTTSGSAPAKAAVRGDVAIAYGLLWQCVNYANENEGLKVIVPEEGLAFDLFTMGMISGHETNESVKEVFTYLYNELNKPQCALFNPDKIYGDMPEAEIANYPTGFKEITMKGLFDPAYKQQLLDQWKY